MTKETARPNPIIRLLPSMTDVAFLMPVVFLFVRLGGAKYILGDGDTGYHIRAGEWILQNGRVPDQDFFSFTKAGEPWYAWEWLWEAAFAWLHRQWGMAAVILASIVVICFTSALLYRLVRRKCGDVLISIGVTFLAVAATSIHWLARPHLFTLLFVVIFCSVLERAYEGRTRLLILLPLLTVVWANLHAGFFVGIVLIATYGAGEVAAALLSVDAPARRAALVRSKAYFFTALGCIAASFINPYTYRLHMHVGRFLTGSFAFRHINEYLSMSFQNPAARYFEALLFLGLATAAWSAYRRRYVYVLLVLCWAHLGLYAVRNVPIFALVVSPAVALALSEIGAKLAAADVGPWLRGAVGAFLNFSSGFSSTDRIARAHITSILAIIIVAVLFRVAGSSTPFYAGYDPKRYPVAAGEILIRPDFSRNVFTNDDWGDYLIYRHYPKVKVFIDGRFDFYGSKFSEQYIQTISGKHNWEQVLDKYGIETVLLPVDAALVGALKESRRWHVVYDDGVAIVFRPAHCSSPGVPAPEASQVPAARAAEFTAIAGSRRSTQLVIDRSQQATRGE